MNPGPPGSRTFLAGIFFLPLPLEVGKPLAVVLELRHGEEARFLLRAELPGGGKLVSPLGNFNALIVSQDGFLPALIAQRLAANLGTFAGSPAGLRDSLGGLRVSLGCHFLEGVFDLLVVICLRHGY